MTKFCSECGTSQEGMDFCPKCNPALFQGQKESRNKKIKNNKENPKIFKWFVIFIIFVSVVNVAPLFFCILFSFLFGVGILSYRNEDFKAQLDKLKPDWLPETDKLTRYLTFGTPVLVLFTLFLLNDPEMKQMRSLQQSGERSNATQTKEPSKDMMYEALITDARTAYSQKNKLLAYEKFKQAQTIKDLPSSDALAVTDSSIYAGKKELEKSSFHDAKDAFELAVKYGAKDISSNLHRAETGILFDEAKELYAAKKYQEFLQKHANLKQAGFQNQDLEDKARYAHKVIAYEKSKTQVTAGKVLSDYYNNKIDAELKYKGKRFEITGIVDSIGEHFGQMYLVLGTGKVFEVTSLQCSFDEKFRAKLATLKKGQKTTVKGTIGSYSLNISVNDCEL
jgi:hypothetical protein